MPHQAESSAQPSNTDTYNLSPVADIPKHKQLILDGRIEDADEIKEFIERRINDGQNPLVHPGYQPMREYSDDAIKVLNSHAEIKKLLDQYNENKKLAEQIKLPEEFYDELFVYLNKLHKIGKNNSLAFTGAWGFYGEAINQCHQARIEFFEKLNSSIGEAELAKNIDSKMISVPLLHGAPVEEKLKTMLHGESPYECVIIQQIFLWKFLKDHRPSVQYPAELLEHNDSLRFDLSRPNTSLSFGLKLRFANAMLGLYENPLLRNRI